MQVIYDKYKINIDTTKELGIDFSMFERLILLRVVDSLWMDHIDQMQILRNEIGLQAYGQRDPVTEYKRQGYEMFDRMVDKIHDDVTAFLLNTKIEVSKQVEMPKQKELKPTEIVDNGPKNPVTKKHEVGRNDPCPCGSGKKYKNCCGKKE